jgi:hypothetical protein
MVNKSGALSGPGSKSTKFVPDTDPEKAISSPMKLQLMAVTFRE